MIFKTDRARELEKNKHDKELIEQAIAINEMTESKGWKILMDLCSGLLERERRALASQPLDNSYYKKIGFLQMQKYFMELPNLIKDKKTRNYLLTQGRTLGLQTAMQSPGLFAEGVVKANVALKSFLEQGFLETQEKSKHKFHEEMLQRT